MTARKKNGGARAVLNTRTDPRCDFIRLGLTGLVIRRNLLFMLIGLEIMINGFALAFVVAGATGARPMVR